MKWTQWIFLKLYERGLAYEGVIPINWCPVDKTGLANEEVSQGRCERCGTPVVRKDMRQWMLRITRYADRLLADLDEARLARVDAGDAAQLDRPQRGGGGRCSRAPRRSPGSEIRVFTTRPDTLYGATYMVLSPEHALVDELTTPAQRAAVTAYQEEARRKSDLERTDLAKDKTGVFTGATATNPVTGKPIPIWIADYVLASYGTGAIMAVPGARRARLRVREEVRPADRPGRSSRPTAARPIRTQPFTDDGRQRQLGPARRPADARGEADDHPRPRGARRRQGRRQLPAARLGVLAPALLGRADPARPLPDRRRRAGAREASCPCACPTSRPTSRPARASRRWRGSTSWVATTCPKCGGPAKRETNTMPQWAGSCWYYLRYLDPKNDARAVRPGAREGVDGRRSLRRRRRARACCTCSTRASGTRCSSTSASCHTKEPFQKLRHQGTVLAYSYQDAMGRYHELGRRRAAGRRAVLKATGETLNVAVEKMAKSKMNGVNPDDVIRDYGADVMRLYEMFMGEFELPKPWDPRAIEGVNRFVKRVWRLVEEWDAGAGARRRSAPAPAPQDDQARHRRPRADAVQHRHRGADGVPERARRRRRDAHARGSADADQAGRPVRPAPRPTRPGQRLGGKGFLLEAAWPPTTTR